MSADRALYRITQGESFFIGFRIEDEAGQPVDLTNSGLTVEVSEGLDEADFFRTTTDALSGEAQVQASNGRTLTWPPGSYDMDIFLFTGGIVDLPRIIVGRLTLEVEAKL